MTRTDTDVHPFDADSRVTPAGDGLFAAEFTDRWNALGGVVNGGYYVAVALQALRHVLPHPEPLAVSTFLLRAGAPGPLEVHTDVARHGRRVSTGSARIVQGGKELARTTATFADLSGVGSGPEAAGGYHEEDFDIWDSTGSLVAQSRQLALLIPG